VSVRDSGNNRIHPPTGTTVEFTISGGEILSAEATKTVRGTSLPADESQFLACVFAQPEAGAANTSLTVTVTTPGETVAEDLLNI
jgi:hypothetical protein